MFDTQEMLNDLKEALNAVLGDQELIELSTKLIKLQVEALEKEGFSREEAIKLFPKGGIQIFKNK